MPQPLIVITGFGPFEEVGDNPSGDVALALAAAPPEGTEVLAGILATSFRRAPEAFDDLLAGADRPPDLLLGLGVHREAGFRVERRGRGGLTGTERRDVDGGTAAEAAVAGPALVTGIDLEALVAEVDREFDERIRVSEEAGGYVCEHLYRHLLEVGRERGIPALFVHVPHRRFTEVERQVELLARIVTRARDGGAPPEVAEV